MSARPNMRVNSPTGCCAGACGGGALDAGNAGDAGIEGPAGWDSEEKNFVNSPLAAGVSGTGDEAAGDWNMRVNSPGSEGLAR